MSETSRLWPDDEHNRTLAALTHPGDWINPEPKPVYNLVVIGAGTAGLIASIGAASVGARVALVERAFTGGDCLNTGCVPSKAVIRSAKTAFEIGRSSDFGLSGRLTSPGMDFSRVMERMRRLRADIGRNDSVERIRSLGIDVFLGEGRFSGRRCLTVEGKVLRYRKAVIATGARPVVPEIPGLDNAGFLTSETVFSLTESPERLAVIGGGPLGCELAQAFGRLGSRVAVIQRHSTFLPKEDREAAKILKDVFLREGVDCRLQTRVKRVEVRDGVKRLHLSGPAGESILDTDQILVAAGRRPFYGSLDLEAAGVDLNDESGLRINRFLQTSNRRIYAAGDACFPQKFTHMAEATARIVVQNALFIRSKSYRSLLLPRCTYTDPEIAHVGISSGEAEAGKISVDTYIRRFEDVDRARLDGEEEGFVKLLTKKGKDKIVGATIVARHAGDMISQISLAMMAGRGLKTLTNVIHPYPTQSEAIKRAAGEYYQRKFSPGMKKILETWFSWKR